MITRVWDQTTTPSNQGNYPIIRHSVRRVVKGAREMGRMEISTETVALASPIGAPDALFELGMLYATGRDVAADLVVAHKWFNLAAARGNQTALMHRVELAREMSAEQVASAQKLAREWLQTH